MSKQWIKIDGEKLEVTKVYNGGYLPMIDIGNMDFYVAESHEAAGEAARRYWEELAQDDPREFTCVVGEETLVQWRLGQWAGPGYTKVTNLNEWLDLWLDTPEEEFGSYDNTELDVEGCSKSLEEELGFRPQVAYRHN